MPEAELGHGAGRLRPPPPPLHFAAVYNLAHVGRSSLARMATAARATTAYTPGAPRPVSGARGIHPDRLVEGTT